MLERLRNRFFGKYRGIVTDVDAATLRIKAKVPAVLADQATGWARPCVPYAGHSVGFAFLPEVGAGVWIEFEGGDVSYPIWVGCYWRDGEQPSDATRKRDKAIVTKAGQKILLDDDAGTITITDPNDNTVTLDVQRHHAHARRQPEVASGDSEGQRQRRRAGGDRERCRHCSPPPAC